MFRPSVVNAVINIIGLKTTILLPHYSGIVVCDGIQFPHYCNHIFVKVRRYVRVSFFFNSERYVKLLATIRFVFKFLCHNLET